MLACINSPSSLFYMHQGHNFFIIVQDDNLPNNIRMDHLAYMIAFLVKICDLVGKILLRWPSHGFGRTPYIIFPLIIDLHNVSNDTLINENRFLHGLGSNFPIIQHLKSLQEIMHQVHFGCLPCDQIQTKQSHVYHPIFISSLQLSFDVHILWFNFDLTCRFPTSRLLLFCFLPHCWWFTIAFILA